MPGDDYLKVWKGLQSEKKRRKKNSDAFLQNDEVALKQAAAQKFRLLLSSLRSAAESVLLLDQVP